jgi:hypothetical protein
MPFVFNDKSTGSCICLRLDLYLSHVKKYNRYAYNNMRDSGLLLFVSLFPYPFHNPPPHMCLRNAYEG